MKNLERSNMLRFSADPNTLLRSRRNAGSVARDGLTVLEVLFSMGIILVGLVGIGFMVPFAGRQAAESYKISHGLASGSNAIAAFKGDNFILPRTERPWQLVDDEYNKASPNIAHTNWPVFTGDWALAPVMGATNRTGFTSFQRLYDGDRAKLPSLYRFHLDRILSAGELAGNPSAQVALAQNRAIGQSFCIDPLFYSEQMAVPRLGNGETKVMRGSWGNFRRNRFPFYDEQFPVSMNPFEFPRSSQFVSPRLVRISYRDSAVPISHAGLSGIPLQLQLDKSWVRGDAARLTSTMESRDLVSEKSEDFGVPLRQFAALTGGADYSAVIKAIESGNMISWLATVVPSDGTPMVNPLSIDPPTPTSLPGMEIFPESYDVSVVVFGRRNVTELATSTLQNGDYAGFSGANVIPTSERLARVISLSADAGSSGTFEVELGSFNSPTVATMDDDPSTVSAKMVPGDWIMLSRYVYDNPLATSDANTFPIREMHRWYRVVGVTGPNIFPRRIRVAGAPWDWSIHELEAIKRQARINPATVVPPIVDPTRFPTVATLLSDVVTVYQRTLTVNK